MKATIEVTLPKHRDRIVSAGGADLVSAKGEEVCMLISQILGWGAVELIPQGRDSYHFLEKVSRYEIQSRNGRVGL